MLEAAAKKHSARSKVECVHWVQHWVPARWVCSIRQDDNNKHGTRCQKMQIPDYSETFSLGGRSVLPAGLGKRHLKKQWGNV